MKAQLAHKGEADWQRIHRLRRFGKPTSPLFPDPRSQLASDWTRVEEDSATWIREEMNRHTYALNGEPVWSSDLYRYVTIHAKGCTPCYVRHHSLSVTQSWKPMEFCCD